MIFKTRNLYRKNRENYCVYTFFLGFLLTISALENGDRSSFSVLLFEFQMTSIEKSLTKNHRVSACANSTISYHSWQTVSHAPYFLKTSLVFSNFVNLASSPALVIALIFLAECATTLHLMSYFA